MAEGDVANVGNWGDADVAIADVGATLPTDPAAFATGWSYFGLLDGDAGISESQSQDSADFSAWGRGVIITKRKNVAITRAVTVLEENMTTLGLRYDASDLETASGVTSGNLAERDPNRKFLLGFDLFEGDQLERLITLGYAQIDSIGDVTESESGLGSFQVTFKVYADNSGNFWRYYKGDAA